MKYLVHRTEGIHSSTLTNSVSVELLVFSFCLVDITVGNPLPSDSPPPVWPRMFGCVANEPSIHHLRMPLPLALRIRGISFDPLRYLTRCLNFDQSSLSGSLARVVRKVIEVQVSGRAHLVAYRVFATIVWKSFALCVPSLVASSSTLKRSTGAAHNLIPFPFESMLSNAWIISFT